MARGTPTADLLTMLRTQLGLSLTSGVAADETTRLKHLLTQKQRWLATEYEWPFLKTRSGVALTTGTRYFNLPTDIDFDHDVTTDVKWNEIWHVVEYGIGPDEFNVWDSDNNEQQAPVFRWQHYGQSQMEVWPIPSIAQTFRFTGAAKLDDFAEDADAVCQLDDTMLVLFIVADEFARKEQRDIARIKLAEAQQRYTRLIAQYPRRDPVWNLNPTDEDDRRRKLVHAVGGGINSLTGSLALENGVDFGSVVYNEQSPAPSGGVLTIQSPFGGLNLFATMTGSPSSTGFDFTLSGLTDSANYVLHYRLHFA